MTKANVFIGSPGPRVFERSTLGLADGSGMLDRIHFKPGPSDLITEPLTTAMPPKGAVEDKVTGSFLELLMDRRGGSGVDVCEPVTFSTPARMPALPRKGCLR